MQVTASAYVAAEIRWPQVFSAERCSPERKAELMAAMRIVRPVLVRGHESMVMLRMLHEDITCGPRILKHWPQVRARVLQTPLNGVPPKLIDYCSPQLRAYRTLHMPCPAHVQAMHEALASWKEDEQPLVELFESTRNEWMTQRTESWMQLQQPYPGVMDALNEGGAPFYIVSSKAAKRVSALAQVVCCRLADTRGRLTESY